MSITFAKKCTSKVTYYSPVAALNIPIGQWHTVKALESGTVILECKDGPYEPLGEDKVMKEEKQ